MIPGSNLLNRAFNLIAQQQLMYLKFLGRILNLVGQDIPSYEPSLITGSFQPVPRRLYTLYGLDFQKSYFTLFASKDIVDVGRDISGDQLIYEGDRYQCLSNTEWFPSDKWVEVLCVLIGENVEENKPTFGFGAYNFNFTHGNLS